MCTWITSFVSNCSRGCFGISINGWTTWRYISLCIKIFSICIWFCYKRCTTSTRRTEIFFFELQFFVLFAVFCDIAFLNFILTAFLLQYNIELLHND
jgi:hypothetical protein